MATNQQEIRDELLLTPEEIRDLLPHSAQTMTKLLNRRESAVAQAQLNKALNYKDSEGNRLLGIIDPDQSAPNNLCFGCMCYHIKNGRQIFEKELNKCGWFKLIDSAKG